MQVTLRQVQIHHGVFQVRVPHEKLDRPQVSPGLHQGCRETVAKRVRADRLLDSCSFRRFAADVPDRVIRKRLFYAAMTLGAGEEINPGVLPAKILAERFEQLGRHEGALDVVVRRQDRQGLIDTMLLVQVGFLNFAALAPGIRLSKDPQRKTFKPADELKQIYDTNSELHTLINWAQKVEGRMKSVGTHACGVVVSRNPLEELAPLF